MADSSFVSKARSKVEKSASSTVNWTIENWRDTHATVVATEASCLVEVGNPKLVLRFFLRPIEKLYGAYEGNGGSYVATEAKWYSLWVEVQTSLQNAAVHVTASVLVEEETLALKVGTIVLNKSKGKVSKVIDEFLYLGSFNIDSIGHKASAYSGFTNGYTVEDVTIVITAALFHLNETGKTVAATCDEENLQTEAEESLTHDLKKMFVEGENFSDLKLQTKDHMTLDAHKFQLAARSRYLRKLIEDATKNEKFDGTIKIDMNGKPLVVILHWIYTGELHDSASKVMEEVVDAAIAFELSHLIKVLDRKLITICNKENMFRLYQVAQKNGMPTAMDNISIYIRENL